MPHLKYEKKHGCDDGKIICGVDEVGRGPLAGPVMAAAVILPREGLPKEISREIRDSKKMSERQREFLFEPIKQYCLYAIAEANIEEITKLNILYASLLAMRRSVDGLKIKIDMALIDGNRVPQLDCPAVAIIKGDNESLSIAAASIIAKVARDRLMKKLAENYPGYGWEHNFGYPTPEHLAALTRLGATDCHRDSFAPVSQLSLLRE